MTPQVTCTDADELTLKLQYAGPLSPEEAARLEQHLAGCADCRSRLTRARAALEQLSALEVPPSVTTQSLAQARARSRGVWVALGLVALVLAGATVATVLQADHDALLAVGLCWVALGVTLALRWAHTRALAVQGEALLTALAADVRRRETGSVGALVVLGWNAACCVLLAFDSSLSTEARVLGGGAALTLLAGVAWVWRVYRPRLRREALALAAR